MKSNFALFFEEYENMHTLEKEEGFVTYKFIDEINACYAVNGFIKKEHRGDKKIFNILNEVVEIAKEKGYNLFISSIDPKSNFPEQSKHVLELYGMKYKRHKDNLDWYVKEI